MALTAPARGRPLLDGADERAFAVTTVALVLAGAPLGLLWQALAPRGEVGRNPAGDLVLADVEDKAFIAADATLFLLGAAVGAVAGLLAWRWGRRVAVGVVLGLAVGGVLGAVVAERTGVLVDDQRGTFASGERRQADGVPLALPNALITENGRTVAVLLGWPAAATLVFAGLAAARPQRLPDE